MLIKCTTKLANYLNSVQFVVHLLLNVLVFRVKVLLMVVSSRPGNWGLGASRLVAGVFR